MAGMDDSDGLGDEITIDPLPAPVTVTGPAHLPKHSCRGGRCRQLALKTRAIERALRAGRAS
jgi:hypothetical protein